MFTKKTRLISLLVTISMLISMVAYFTISVTANSGAIEIDAASDFASIELDGNYILVNDIDFTDVSHTPIGTINAPFTGTFDGDGYTIKNLTLASDDNFQGLFGVNNGTICNVKMDSTCSISGNAYVGAIAGKNASSGIIENCISEATVSYTKSSTADGTYKVMTQNLCQWGDSEFAKYDTYLSSSAQLSRRPGMLARIKEVNPDLIAFQENSFTNMDKVSEDASWWDKLTGNDTNVVTAWKTVLENDTDLKSTYTFFGSQGSMTSVPNEGATVAYKTDKFNLLTSGTFWHSTNPDASIEEQDANWDVEQANGELWGFGAGNKRVVNWVALEDKSTGQKIVLYSLHPQHDSEEVRMKEIPVLIDKMNALRETYPDAIFIAAGDYNANKGVGSYNLVENWLNGEMDNAKDIAQSYVDGSDTKNTSGNIYVGATGTIDHIMIDGSAANVTSFEIRDELYDSVGTKYAASEITTDAESAYTGASDTLITRTTPLRPSDHNGVVATFETKTNYAIGGVVGENDGTVRQIVAEGTADVSGVGVNNKTAVALYGTGTVIGSGTTTGAAALTEEPSFEIVWKLNHAADADVFALVDGDYRILREGDTYETPVRVRVNGINYYTLPNSGAFDLDQLGIKDPHLIQSGKLIENPTITVGEEDIEVAVADSIMNVEKMATTGVNDFVIDNQDELEYADSKLSYINKENVVLYLGADIDLTDTTFNGFEGKILFSLNGMGYTIKNWNTGAKGFFIGDTGTVNGYQGDYIKNVTFDNVHTKGTYGRAVVVANAAGNNDFLMENVHVKNSSTTITNAQNLAAILYTHSNSTFDKTVTIRNCSVINSQIKKADGITGRTNSGVVSGRIGNGIDYIVSDIYVKGFDNLVSDEGATGSKGNGILFGTKEDTTTLTLENACIFDSSAPNFGYDLIGWHYHGTFKATNVVSIGNSSSGLLSKYNNSHVVTYTNLYTDQTNKLTLNDSSANDGVPIEEQTTVDGATEKTAAQIDAAFSYAFNNALSDPAMYWEVDEESTTGALKPATAAEQTRKVTLQVGETDTVYYADGGETLTIPTTEGDYFYVVEGNGSIADGVLTVSTDADTVVRQVTSSDPAYAVIEALKYFEGKNLDYYENGDKIAAAIEELKAGIKNGSYTTEILATAAVQKLSIYQVDGKYPYVTPDGADVKLPSVQEIATYTDAPGYMINNVDDLLYVKSVETGFTIDHTLYLGADLDLKGVEFVGFSGVYFDFDGLGHTLTNWGVDMESKAIGLFHYSFNNSVKNLNIDGAKLDSTGYNHVSVIYGCHNSTNATGATGDLTFENIHIKNTSLTKSTGQGAFIISNLQAGRDNVTLNNCTVENSEITGSGSNLGALVGRTYTTTVVLTVKNCFVNNVDIKGGTTYCGILIGSLEGGCTPKIYNTVLMNSSTDASGTDTGVVAFANSNAITFENFVSYNNTGAENFIGGTLTTHSATNSYFTEDYTPNFGFVRVKENAIANGYVAAMLNTKVTDANGYTYWTMDDATGLLTFGTKENQTLSITYKVNGNVVATDVAGSGATVELGLDADPAATFAVNAGTLAADGKTLTMPTDGTHVVVTVTPSGEDFAYLGYPSVTTVSTAVTSGDYTVANATEWMYLYNNYTTLFNNTNITIHLIGTIDLSDGVASSFKGFINACFSVDGHGNTICNWGTEASPISADGIFRSANSSYGGTGTPALMNSLKNFTVDNVHIKGTNRGNGLVLGFGAANSGLSGIPTSFVMEGVTVKNSSLVANGEDSAILVPRYSNSDVTTESLTITRCAVIDTTFTSNAAHHGVLYGKAPGSTGTAYIYGNYMRNVTAIANGASAAYGALTIGSIEGSTVHLYYNTVIDSSITAATGTEAYLAANSTGGSHYNRYNIFINNTLTSDTGTYYVGSADGTAAKATTCNNTNQVSDSKIAGAHATGTTYGCLEGATGSWVTCPSAANIANGYVAYTNNNYLSDNNQNSLLANRVVFWEMEDGKIVPTDKAGQTVKVTLKSAGGSTIGTYYTDGGEPFTLLLGEGEVATLASGSSATASISGNIFTAPTDGSDTEVIIGGSAVLTYPSVSTVTAAVTEEGPFNYTIYNETDWAYVAGHMDYYNNSDIVIHLAADMDLSKITFAQFDDPYFSFDGHGHTVRNWGSSEVQQSSDGMFRFNTQEATANSTMRYLKNLRLEDCHTKASGGTYNGAALLVGMQGGNGGYTSLSQNFTIENVHIVDCSFVGYGAINALMLSGYATSTADYEINIKNCSIVDSVMTAGVPVDDGKSSAGHAGLLIGKLSGFTNEKNGTVNIQNVYISGNTYNAGRNDYDTMVIGNIEKGSTGVVTTTFTNVVVIGNTANYLEADVGLLANTASAPIKANGVVLADNTINSSVEITSKSIVSKTATGTMTFTDVYCDDADVTADQQGVAGLTTAIGTTDLVSGKAAAAVNNAGENSVFYYTTTEDGVELGTEANATRRVSFQAAGREVGLAGFANGGEEMELSYTAPYETTLVAQAGSLEGSVLTLPTEGYMIVPVAVTPTESEMQTVYGYQGVKEITSAVTTGDYTVANAEEWMYVNDNKAFFSALDVTIHLIGDIDFSETIASNFTGFQNVKFSLNGHDHTLKDWKPSSNANGLFNTNNDAGMKFIKNFTIDGANVKLNTWAALVFGSTSNAANNAGYYANFELSGIHVKNTTVTATGNGATALFGQYRRASGVATTVTVHDCSFENVDVIGTGSSANHGMIFGRLDKGATFNIYDIYINNCSVSKASNSGIVGSGLEAGTLNAQNIGVFNSTHTPIAGQDAHLFCIQTGGTMIFRYNIFAGNTLNNGEGCGKYVIGGSVGNNANVGGSSINDTNQCDDPALAEAHYAATLAGAVKGYDSKHLKKGLTEEDFTKGAVAYTNNGYSADLLANRSLFWTVDAEGNIIPADGNQTRKVTFTVVDEEGNASESQAYTYYTDYTKKLIPDFDSFLYQNYTWTEATSGETYTTDTTFSADAVYTAVGLILDELEDAIAYFNGKNLGEGTYFVDAAGIQALLDEVRVRIAENEYQVSENAVPGLGAASLAKDIKLIQERYATYQEPNEGYTNVPKVSEVGTYWDAFHYTIWNETDLLTTKTNELKYPKDSTINLMADLDLTEKSFAGFTKPYFNFDGHNHTISNWSYTAASTYGVAFISRGAATSIKNIVFDNVHLVGAGQTGIVYGSHSGDNVNNKLADGTSVSGTLTFENIHVRNSSVNSSSHEQVAIFLPNTQSGRTGYAFNNCSIVDCTVDSGGKGNVSGFVARLAGGVPVTITNSYIEGLTIPNGGSNTSVFCGQPHSGSSYCSVENVAAFDCDITGTGDIYYFGARKAVGQSTNTGGVPILKNVLLSNNKLTTDGTGYISAGNLDNYSFTKTGVGNEVNVYVDATTRSYLHETYPIYHNHDSNGPETNIKMPTVLDAAEFTTGEAAWKANQILAEPYWKVGEHGDYPMNGTLAAADWEIPYQINLVENRTAEGETYDYYTDKIGALNTTAKDQMDPHTWYDDADGTYTAISTYSADNTLTLEAIVSIDVSWGEMQFVYDFGEWDEDALKWVNSSWGLEEDTSNEITFANNGTVYKTVALGYAKTDDTNGVDGYFTDVNDAAAGDLTAIPMNADGTPLTYKFMLDGVSEEIWETAEYRTVGTLTLSIV